MQQGCVLSPLLYTLLTHTCSVEFISNHIIKFANDASVVGLINNNDESAYMEEVVRFTAWCKSKNLSLNVDKTKEMSENLALHTFHSPLMASLLRGLRGTKFIVSTFQTILFGPSIPHLYQRRHNNIYIFSRDKRELVSPLPFTPLQRHDQKCLVQLHHCLVQEFQRISE